MRNPEVTFHGQMTEYRLNLGRVSIGTEDEGPINASALALGPGPARVHHVRRVHRRVRRL
jgi:hypothetical protein